MELPQWLVRHMALMLIRLVPISRDQIRHHCRNSDYFRIELLLRSELKHSDWMLHVLTIWRAFFRLYSEIF